MKVARLEASTREEIERHAGRKAALNFKCLKAEDEEGGIDLWMVIEPADVPEHMQAQFEANL